MTQSHRIDEAFIHIAFSRQTDEQREKDRLGRMMEARLMVVVDEVLNEFSHVDEQVQIDQLNIDLGSIPYPHFQQEMEGRLRQELKDVLTKNLRVQQGGEKPDRRPIPDPETIREEIPTVLSSSRMWEKTRGNIHSQKAPPIEGTGPEKSLQEKLIRTLMGDQTEGWEEVWSLCLRSHPEFLKEILKQYVKQARVRKAMATTFPLALLLNIVRVFHPNATKWIENIHKAEERNGQRDTGTTEERRVFKQRLWDITLVNIVLEQKATFQPDVWVARLFQHMGRDVESGGTMQRVRLKTLLEQCEGSERVTQEQLRDFEAVVKEQTDAQPFAHASHAQRVALIRSYEFYEELKAYLCDGIQRRNEEGLAHIIEELGQNVPWLLLRLLRELQTKESTKIQWSAHISEGLLHQLLQAMVSLTYQPEEEPSPYLLEALEVYAKRVKHKQPYYRKVLECLVQNTVVDFEAILEEVATWTPKETASELSKGPLSSETFRQSITRFLERTFQTGDEELQNFLSAIDAYAQKVQEPTRYYEHVLHELEQKKNIDLEHILDEIQPSSRIKASGQFQDEEVELLQYLRSGCKASLREKEQMCRTLERMVAQQPQFLRQICEAALEIPGAAARLTEWVPEPLLAKILHLLRPSDYQGLQTYAEIMANACYGKAVSLSSTAIQQLKWECVFQYAITEGQPFETKTFVMTFIECVAQRVNEATLEDVKIWLSQQMAMDLLPSTVEAQGMIMNCLAQRGEDTSQMKYESSPNVRTRTIKNVEQEESEWVEDLYVHNAGQVLAAPYMARLFELLNLTQGTAFLDRTSAVKGVHVLQFMVNERTKSPEYQLVLNKILCGVRTGIPIEPEVILNEQEKMIIEDMLKGMIQNWKSIGQTSVSGLRESFLQREGRLQLKDEAWHLNVEPKSFDMLLDQLPWGFSTIKFPWMERVLYVKWR